jgi:hypothetical protein
MPTPESIAYHRDYYQRNKDKFNANKERWRKANRERCNEIALAGYHRRRARKLAAAAAADPSTVVATPPPPPPPQQPAPPQPKSLYVVWGSFTS